MYGYKKLSESPAAHTHTHTHTHTHAHTHAERGRERERGRELLSELTKALLSLQDQIRH